ncbi:MAG: capsular biosynthesis protein [Muribaculaceae bacterium]|nr:capsular biosynthesis protein [Muribaculaceae bacterium]
MKGFTDWHCHILPGVDDGVDSMEQSLRILADYDAMGVARVWFTPHIMEDVPNTPEALRARFEELKEAYKGPLELHLAAENMMDNLFEERLESGELLPIGPEGNHLLVETSYYTPPMDLYGILERIKSAGYFPLLAHPERYRYMELADYDRLHSMGIKMQMNLSSLAGLYGPDVRERAKHLLKAGYYHATGTDLHRHRMLAPTVNASLPGKIMELIPHPDRL